MPCLQPSVRCAHLPHCQCPLLLPWNSIQTPFRLGCASPSKGSQGMQVDARAESQRCWNAHGQRQNPCRGSWSRLRGPVRPTVPGCHLHAPGLAQRLCQTLPWPVHPLGNCRAAVELGERGLRRRGYATLQASDTSG